MSRERNWRRAREQRARPSARCSSVARRHLVEDDLDLALVETVQRRGEAIGIGLIPVDDHQRPVDEIAPERRNAGCSGSGGPSITSTS